MIAAVILLGYMILMGMAGAAPAFAEDAAETGAEEIVRIDVTVGPHGMVNGHAESYTETAAADTETMFTLKADEGYVIGSVKVNDADLAPEDLEGIVGAEEADLEIESSAGALNLAVAFREKGVDVATATGEIAGGIGALVTDASESVTEAVEDEADDESGSDEVAGDDEDGDEVAGTEGPGGDENDEPGEDAGDEETDIGAEGTEAEDTGAEDPTNPADGAGADGTASDGASAGEASAGGASAGGATEAEAASPDVPGNTSSDDASGETAAESTEGDDESRESDESEPNETTDSDAAVQTGDTFSGMSLLLMALSMTMLCILGCRGVRRR